MKTISEQVKALNFDVFSFMMILSENIQSWTTVPELFDPSKIVNKEHVMELLIFIYELLSSPLEKSDEMYGKVYMLLPEYQAIVLRHLIGNQEETDGLPDVKLFLEMMYKSSQQWFTVEMPRSPDRMTLSQSLLAVKTTANFCLNHPRSGLEYEKVIMKLPDWNKMVCNNMLTEEKTSLNPSD